MKLRVYSDLHREFDGWNIPELEDEGERVLVLAGDIAVARRNNSWKRFLPEVAERHKAVVYIPGNHEYYGDSWERAWYKIQQDWEIDNLHFLNKQTVILDDVMFIGATLWTDMMNRNTEVMRAAGQYMNDYRVIKRLYWGDHGEYIGKLHPRDTIREHERAREFIDTTLDAFGNDHKTVVVTHHAPTWRSVCHKFHGDILNGAYVSDLTELIRERAPDIWIHGHVHASMEYVEGNTLVVANPKGYPNQGYMDEPPYENLGFKEDGVLTAVDEVLKA